MDSQEIMYVYLYSYHQFLFKLNPGFFRLHTNKVNLVTATGELTNMVFREIVYGVDGVSIASPNELAGPFISTIRS